MQGERVAVLSLGWSHAGLDSWHYDEPDSIESTPSVMPREVGTLFLPTRRHVSIAAYARTCVPPWHPWTRGAIARAERAADGRIHLAVLRSRRGGVAAYVSGVGAAQSEVLAPLASRLRHALASATPDVLGGTSAFEDAVWTLLADAPDPAGARRKFCRLGARCPTAPRLRTMPDPRTLCRAPRPVLAQTLGSRPLAERLHALARAFAALAPCEPSRS